MKKLMIILFLATLGMNAQDRKFEEIKAHKTAFITEEVNLTSTQAEKFWPIYNKHEQEVMALRKTQLEGFKTLRNKNVDDLIKIMNGFPLNRYSRKLTGDNMYLWEA